MTDAASDVPSHELERTVSEVEASEFLERFVSENWVDRRGNLKWQALQIHKKDDGALSVARLNANPDQCKAIAVGKMNSFVGFAETVAVRVTDLGHEVKAEPEEDFPNHAVVNFTGLDPAWPVAYEAGDPGPEKLKEMDYYKAILPNFRLVTVPDPTADPWGAERLGQLV